MSPFSRVSSLTRQPVEKIRPPCCLMEANQLIYQLTWVTEPGSWTWLVPPSSASKREGRNDCTLWFCRRKREKRHHVIEAYLLVLFLRRQRHGFIRRGQAIYGGAGRVRPQPLFFFVFFNFSDNNDYTLLNWALKNHSTCNPADSFPAEKQLDRANL